MKRSLAVSAFAVTAVALLVCGAGFAQQPPPNSPPISLSFVGPAGGFGQEASFMSEAVKNAPYSAKQTRQTTQTLGDGTHITTSSTTNVYRDSSGRTRTEVNDEIATINDPVGGATYRLNMKQQTASTIRLMKPVGVAADTYKVQLDSLQAMKLAERDAQTNTIGGDVIYSVSTTGGTITVNKVEGGAGNPPEVVRESLGTQTIEGLVVEGTRVTRTTPQGAIGNDRPIVTVTERWYSPDLQLYVMTKTSDPRNGETIIQLTGVNRAEPDASLFQIPANYKVVGGLGGRGGGRND
ncbi:MAG TPA: hypothetical protein VGZ48_11250 [Candidatus Acidoferrales bacterium]|jgi:hypothetical protein|nr:hypothetical protein [Candidatus Acidoferrales bacterium]